MGPSRAHRRGPSARGQRAFLEGKSTWIIGPSTGVVNVVLWARLKERTRPRVLCRPPRNAEKTAQGVRTCRFRQGRLSAWRRTLGPLWLTRGRSMIDKRA